MKNILASLSALCVSSAFVFALPLSEAELNNGEIESYRDDSIAEMLTPATRERIQSQRRTIFYGNQMGSASVSLSANSIDTAPAVSVATSSQAVRETGNTGVIADPLPVGSTLPGAVVGSTGGLIRSGGSTNANISIDNGPRLPADYLITASTDLGEGWFWNELLDAFWLNDTRDWAWSADFGWFFVNSPANHISSSWFYMQDFQGWFWMSSDLGFGRAWDNTLSSMVWWSNEGFDWVPYAAGDK